MLMDPYINGALCLWLHFQNYYTLALDDGKMEGRFSGNSRPKIIKSNRIYNDGRTHTVGVLKRDRV
jgi:hypothetical protein